MAGDVAELEGRAALFKRLCVACRVPCRVTSVRCSPLGAGRCRATKLPTITDGQDDTEPSSPPDSPSDAADHSATSVASAGAGAGAGAGASTNGSRGDDGGSGGSSTPKVPPRSVACGGAWYVSYFFPLRCLYPHVGEAPFGRGFGRHGHATRRGVAIALAVRQRARSTHHLCRRRPQPSSMLR